MLQLTIVKKNRWYYPFSYRKHDWFYAINYFKKIPTWGGDEINEKLIIIKEPINPLIYCNINGCQLW